MALLTVSLAALLVDRQREIAILKDENGRLQAENRQLGERLETIRSVALPIAKQTLDRSRKSVNRKLWALPARHVPWVGPFVSVAVTGMEIDDRCATMRDMNKLVRAIDPSEEDDDGEGLVCETVVPSVEWVESAVTKPAELVRDGWSHLGELVTDSGFLERWWKLISLR